MATSFPPPPINGDTLTAAPEGLEQGVGKLFGRLPGVPGAEEDVYASLDLKVLLKRFEDTKRAAEDGRPIFERQWWRALLYVLGRQWIYFDAKRSAWKDKRLKKWVPKPVTNKMKEVVQAIRAMFASVKLGVIVRPNGNDPKNIVAANTSDMIHPLIHEEHEMDRVLREGDLSFIIMGNVFYHPWWDKDVKYGIKPVMKDKCLTCGQVWGPEELGSPTQPICPDPECGGIEFEPVEEQVPIGRGCTDAVSPLEVLIPSYYSAFREVRKLIRSRWRPREYYEDNYPEIAAKIQWQKAPQERSLALFKSLAQQNDISNMPATWGGGGGVSQSEGIAEYEYWEQPSALYPKGLFFRVIGDTSPFIFEDPEQGSPGPLPYVTKQGQPMWPWLHAGYEPFLGRLFAAGALDPLIQKQDQINQLDSLMQLIVQRMANPIWLEPKGAEVEKFTGEPGLVVKYSMIGTTGAGKPERIDGTGPSPSLFQLREQYLKDIEELAGTFDIIKGQKPTGVEAFSALQLLVERSQSRFTTAFNERGEAYRAWFSIALELERMYGPTERTMATLGPNNTWAFAQFDQANLQGSTSVVVEDGSNVPKTSLGERAAMEQANNMKLLNPQDPDQSYTMLTKLGLTGLIPGLDSAVKAAQREQEAFEKWIVQPAAPQPQIDPATGQPLPMDPAMQPPMGPDGQPVQYRDPMPPLSVRPWDGGTTGQGIAARIGELQKWANSDKMQEILTQYPDASFYLGTYYMGLMQLLGGIMSGSVMGMGMAAPGTEPSPGNGGGAGAAQGLSNSNQNSGSTANVPSDQPGPAAPPL
jgi:hypothetical protein